MKCAIQIEFEYFPIIRILLIDSDFVIVVHSLDLHLILNRRKFSWLMSNRICYTIDLINYFFFLYKYYIDKL